MATIVKNGKPSPCSQLPPHGHRVPVDAQDKGAGEALAAGDVCYIKNDGKVYRSSGAAAAPATAFAGMCPTDIPLGEPVSLFHSERFDYGTGLTPGAWYYVSAATPGGIDDVAPYAGALPIGFAIDTTRIQLVGPHN